MGTSYESETLNDQAEILIWFSDLQGIRDLAARPQDMERLTEKSEQALNKAMAGIKNMVGRVVMMVNSIKLHERPTTIEMKFGLKLTSDANVFIAQAGAESQIVVTLVW